MTPLLPLLLLMAAPPKPETPPNLSVAPPPPTVTAVQIRPNPEAFAAALELHDPKEIKQVALATGMRLTLAPLDNDRKMRARRGQKISDALYEKMKAFAVEDIERTYAELAPSLHRRAATIYARYFTAAELRELKLLNAHPVMRKMQLISPAMSVDMAEFYMQAAAARDPERQRKMQEMIAQWMADERLRRTSKSST